MDQHATVAGPVVGGAIVEALSWRGIFFLNIPLAIVTVVLTLVSRDACRTKLRHRHLDVYGAVLGAIAVGALVWALVEGPESGFGSPTVVAGFVLAGVAFAAFLWVESRLAEPMMPLSLFRIRELSVANLATFFVYAALGSALFYVTLFAQSVLGYSPTKAGLVVAPISIVLWAARRPFRSCVRPASAHASFSSRSRADRHRAGLARPAGGRRELLGRGLSGAARLLHRPCRDGAGHHLDRAEAGAGGPDGIASGINTTLSRLGQLVAVAVLGVVVSLVYSAADGNPFELGERTAAELAEAADAFQAAMWVAAGLAFAGALVSGLGLPRRARSEATAPADGTARSAASRVSPHSVKIASR